PGSRAASLASGKARRYIGRVRTPAGIRDHAIGTDSRASARIRAALIARKLRRYAGTVYVALGHATALRQARSVAAPGTDIAGCLATNTADGAKAAGHGQSGASCKQG